MVSTSWMRKIDESLQGVDIDLNADTSIRFPEFIYGWLRWKPESHFGWLVRWCIALPILVVVVIICLMIAFAKLCIWLVGLLPALLIFLLLSIKFTRSVDMQ